MDRCFACDRKLGKNPKLVDTRDDQTVHVGSECFKCIEAAGEQGWQPPKGGPRLYLLDTAEADLRAALAELKNRDAESFFVDAPDNIPMKTRTTH